jgi:murein DD-endopeptidase MepM/ murein hydrolase activator NlpD
MAAIEGGTLQRVASEKELIAGTGINADHFLRKLENVEGVGGPEVSLNAVQLDGVSDRDFGQAYFRAEANLEELADLRRAVTWLPTAMPLGLVMERTSGFGPRLDPFSGRYAFHPGIDFAGPTGTAVLATAGGLVTFAGSDGSYGNMVEIDHGYGLRTRYAHLLRIAVTKGERVTKAAVVGWLGSTGRSTGPHVHYEVWYEDEVRNPDGFLRVGRLSGNNYCTVITCSPLRR